MKPSLIHGLRLPVVCAYLAMLVFCLAAYWGLSVASVWAWAWVSGEVSGGVRS